MPRSTSWRTCSPAAGRPASIDGSCTNCKSRPTSWRSKTAAASTANSRYTLPPAPATTSASCSASSTKNSESSRTGARRPARWSGPDRLSAQVDRTKPPALLPPPALKLPAVQTTTLPNGLTLAVVGMHKVPVVDVQLLVDAGAARDPSAAPGLATFTATMLQQGAGARSALDVADEAAFLSAQLNTAASFDAASASIHVPKRRLEGALDLLADVVLRPSFADSEVARQRQLRAAQLVQQRDEPVAVADVVFPAIVYGREHPYGHPLNGTDSATARLARARVGEFYRSYYRPNGGRLLVVGDVTLAGARRLLNARVGRSG